MHAGVLSYGCAMSKQDSQQVGGGASLGILHQLSRASPPAMNWLLSASCLLCCDIPEAGATPCRAFGSLSLTHAPQLLFHCLSPGFATLPPPCHAGASVGRQNSRSEVSHSLTRRNCLFDCLFPGYPFLPARLARRPGVRTAAVRGACPAGCHLCLLSGATWGWHQPRAQEGVAVAVAPAAPRS